MTQMFRELQLRTMLYGSSLFKLVISFIENPRISKHVFKRYRKTGQDKRRRHQGNHFINVPHVCALLSEQGCAGRVGVVVVSGGFG